MFINLIKCVNVVNQLNKLQTALPSIDYFPITACLVVFYTKLHKIQTETKHTHKHTQSNHTPGQV